MGGRIKGVQRVHLKWSSLWEGLDGGGQVCEGGVCVGVHTHPHVPGALNWKL